MEQKKPLLRDKNIHVIFGITLSAVMGVSSIAPALPSIARSLDISTDQIGLLITVFTLPGIFLTPVLGILADRFGRKRILIPSLMLFGVAGVLCGFSTNFTQLLWLRFFQGFGAAALGTLNVTLIGDLYKGNRRATAMGYNGSVLSVGTAAYPAVGGALAMLGWNYPFFLSVIAIPVGLYAAIALKPIPLQNSTSLKTYFGNIFTALRKPLVLGLFASIFLTFFILYGGYITFFPILLDEKYGVSPLFIGLLLSSTSIITGLTSLQLGWLTRRFAEQGLMLIGAILYFLIFLVIPSIENIWMLLIPIFFFGVAQGLNIPSILNLLTGQVPSDYRAAFLSVNWMVIRCGQTISPYLLGIAYVMFGVNGTFYVTSVAAGLFILLAFWLYKNSGK